MTSLPIRTPLSLRPLRFDLTVCGNAPLTNNPQSTRLLAKEPVPRGQLPWLTRLLAALNGALYNKITQVPKRFCLGTWAYDNQPVFAPVPCL